MWFVFVNDHATSKKSVRKRFRNDNTLMANLKWVLKMQSAQLKPRLFIYYYGFKVLKI